MVTFKKFFLLGLLACLVVPVGCSGGGEPVMPKAQNPDPSLQPASREMGGGEAVQNQGPLELQ